MQEHSSVISSPAMIYSKELVRQRPKRGLQKFDPQIDVRSYKQLLLSSLSKSSIHGVQQLAISQQRIIVAFFWLILVVGAIFATIAMYLSLSQRHNEQQLKTVVETSQLPVYNVEFPAIAICPWNRVNWIRYKAGEKRFLPANATQEMKSAFRQLILALADMSFGRFDRLYVMNDVKLEYVQNLSITELAKFFVLRCDELFVASTCVFDETPHDCCKLFIPENTERGICMVFNSLISEESRKMTLSFPNYPWKINKAGEGSGLKFTLRHNTSYASDEFHIPFGFSIMIKAPRDFSSPSVHYLLPNTDTFISVNPQITVTSHNTQNLQPSKRRCLFNEEKPLEYKRWVLDYSQLNCLARCRKFHLYNICNCTTKLYFPESALDSERATECNASHFRCFYENRDIFSYIKVPRQDDFIEENRRGMLCDCLPSCYSIFYLTMLNVKKFDFQPNATLTPIIKADIHFAQRTMIKYSTKLEFTLMDLFANFGGVLGLFLGASVLSLIEVAIIVLKFLRSLCIDRHILRQMLAKRLKRRVVPK